LTFKYTFNQIEIIYSQRILVRIENGGKMPKKVLQYDNSYMALLIRGHDGFIIFIPGKEKFNTTDDALISAGVCNL